VVVDRFSQYRSSPITEKMEFDEHEEQEEDMMEIPTPPPGYESVSNSARPKMGSNRGESTKGGGSTTSFRYRECLKNHAVSIGGHAVDGCGEFMAAGEEGTLDALKCAACSCHRNFHRKETDGSSEPSLLYRQFSPYYRSAPPPQQAGYHHFRLTTASQHHRPPLPLPAGSGGGGHSREGEDMSNPSSSGGGGGGGGGSSGLKKRFRTKFSQEQKEKMLAFAESVGWRIQKHDEAAVEQFCTDTGTKRHVLKVWMHNNKQTLGKKP
jgi:ZF-HD class homeobox domain-containing protein